MSLDNIVTSREQLSKYHFHFETVLDHKVLNDLFCEYLHIENVYESYLFIQRVQEFILLHSDQKRYAKAKEIIDQFILSKSPSEINTQANLKNDVLEKFEKCTATACPSDLFKVLYTVIISDLKEDVWLRFKKWERFCDKVLELTREDQSIVLELCITESSADKLIDEFLTDNDKYQSLLVDIRRRSQGVVENVSLVMKKKSFLSLKGSSVLCASGYDFVNWVCGYLQLKRPAALEFIHKVFQSEKSFIIEHVTTEKKGKDKKSLMVDSKELLYHFTPKKRLVIVGGGYAGSMLAKNCQDKLDVMLIDRKQRFESVFSFPQLISDPNNIHKISSPHTDYLKNGRVIQEKVELVTPYFVQLSTERIYYDYLVLATGSSYVQFPVEHAPNSPAPVILNPYDSQSLIDCHAHLKQCKNIVCVGGGSVAVEIAGEIAHFFPDIKITLLTAANTLMNRTSPTVHDTIVKFFSKYKNIEVNYNCLVKRIADNNVIYTKKSNSEEELAMPFDLVVVAVGFCPNTQLLEATMASSLDDYKRVKVNSQFQVFKDQTQVYDNIFAIGDITNIDEEKLAQVAQKHAHKLVKILSHYNDTSEAKAKSSLSYTPRSRIMIVSVGPKHGVLIRDEQVLIENSITLKAKSMVEYRLMKSLWK